MNIKLIEILKDEQLKEKFIEAIKPELKDEALSEDFLAKVSAGGGRWFLPDDTVCGVCNDCKRYTFMNAITGEICDTCGKSFTKLVYAIELPDDYVMNL